MRLIDADELMETLRAYKNYPFGLSIDEIPTVDAIPVEWIKKWLENIKNDRRYKSEYVELTQDVKQVVYKGTMLIRIPCISDMLEDWENKNG